MAATRLRRMLPRSIAAIVFGYATLASTAVLADDNTTSSAASEDTVAAASPLVATSSKAPASRLVLVPVQSPSPSSVALATSAEPPEPSDDRIPHRGLVADANVGVLGCFATSCKQRHAAAPGVRVGGFIGGNIRGWVSIGVAGGWGTLSPDPPAGSDVLGLYGLDADALMSEFDTPAGNAAPADLASLSVTGAQLRAAQVGPMLRVHFIPRGRLTAWVGSGAQYNFLSSSYSTPAGKVDLQLHGLAVPIEAGFGVYITKHLAATAQFDYLWSRYALAKLLVAGDKTLLPVTVLDDIGRGQGADFAGGLPHFWTVGFGLRMRL